MLLVGGCNNRLRGEHFGFTSQPVRVLGVAVSRSFVDSPAGANTRQRTRVGGFYQPASRRTDSRPNGLTFV